MAQQDCAPSAHPSQHCSGTPEASLGRARQDTHLIQDSSSSMSRKNWCRRWDSLSLARREAAMFLIFWKRPLMASRLSFTWEVSKALLVIRLSAWLLRSFRRSWRGETGGSGVREELGTPYCGVTVICYQTAMTCVPHSVSVCPVGTPVMGLEPTRAKIQARQTAAAYPTLPTLPTRNRKKMPFS